MNDSSGRRRVTLHHLAKLMADREVLGLPIAQVEEHYKDIQSLAAAGLLRIDSGPRRVEFRHQTLYEFVRARSFLEASGSLTESVRAQQNSLRIRPQLWHALGYFRCASPEEYGTEIENLWLADLRPHLKMLIIEFLGLQTTLIFAERRLVEKYIADQWFLPRFICAAVQSPGWFSYLSSIHLPKLMKLPVQQASIVLPMLRHALYFDPDRVVTLVYTYWLNNHDYDLLTWQALGSGDVAPQLGQWLDSLIIIAARTPLADWSIGHISGVVSAAHPEFAPKLVAAWLKGKLDFATKSLSNASGEDETAHELSIKNVQSVLEARQFYEIEAIADAAPRAFIVALWPILLESLQFVTSTEQSHKVSYRQSHGLIFEALDDEESQLDRPLLQSVRIGIERWAEAEPKSFLEFVSINTNSELLLVHRLLAIGLTRCAEHSVAFICDYLCSDPRRLVLGPFTDIHKESVALIKTIGPLLDASTYEHLEQTLRDFNYYNSTAEQFDADFRQKQLKWAREHRLRLLRALPENRLNLDLKRLIEEEERAFPKLNDKDAHFFGIQSIESPLSVQQMQLATDADILNLFNELTDEAGWDHPRLWMKGGAVQAGRQLAELTKIDLSKTLRIIRMLAPECNQIPVGCVLRELISAGMPPQELYLLIAELEDKGFTGANFQQSAAYAIKQSITQKVPVPDDLLARLENWLHSVDTKDDSESEPEVEEYSRSILWGGGALRVVPNGNYPVLQAITAACFNATPPKHERWINILEHHTSQLESLKVWNALLESELNYLQRVDRIRSENLVDKLLLVAPKIIEGQGWALFIARAFHWASIESSQRWLASTITQGGKRLQAAGELACLRYALFPAEDWSRGLVEQFIVEPDSERTVGVAHGVARLWEQPMFRPVVHPMLLKLFSSPNERVLNALSGIFVSNGFTRDDETWQVLDSLNDNPKILQGGRAEQLPELLAGLVSVEPKRVVRLIHTILNIVGEQLGNRASYWYLSSEWLVDIALQLQDMDGSERTAGAELFERMLEFNMPHAKELTLDLDKRTPVLNSLSRAPVRRRSRTSLHKLN